MKGTIKTYLPDKKYGFIKGDDGKDYFLHESEFTDKNQLGKICEEAFVNFDQKATPKGYKAQNGILINPSEVLTYIVPDEFITSRSNNIKGWDVIEQGQWIVHGSSRNSPEAAKRASVGCVLRTINLCIKRCVGRTLRLLVQVSHATARTPTFWCRRKVRQRWNGFNNRITQFRCQTLIFQIHP